MCMCMCTYIFSFFTSKRFIQLHVVPIMVYIIVYGLHPVSYIFLFCSVYLKYIQHPTKNTLIHKIGTFNVHNNGVQLKHILSILQTTYKQCFCAFNNKNTKCEITKMEFGLLSKNIV